MKDTEEGLLVFADCISVKGNTRGVLYDLNRKEYKIIPNTLVDFIVKSGGKSKLSIYKNYKANESATVDEYIDFLISNNYALWVKKNYIKQFSQLSLSWAFPGLISNAILDIDSKSNYDLVGVLNQIEKLGCKHVQIRSFSTKELTFFDTILTACLNSSFASFEILTPYNINISEDETIRLLDSHKRLKILAFHSAPFTKICQAPQYNTQSTITYTKQIITSPTDCHNNDKGYFSVSVDFFTEAVNYHSYFNKKLSIDKDGNVKNCSSQQKHYGNVNATTLKKALESKTFNILGGVKKDDTLICQDCEFRYMCMDSRLPNKFGKNKWVHNTECNYNPYICKWKGELGYRSLKESGIVITNKGITIDHTQLNKINKELWS